MASFANVAARRCASPFVTGMVVAAAGGDSGALEAKAQGAWRLGAWAGDLPSFCVASTEHMTKGEAPAAGIQPSGRTARSTIAASARLTASDLAKVKRMEPF